jgi:TolB-like protein/Tfp pilus assembly protein PilF
MSLVAELRRRQVFRAAAWYGGVAWLAIQVADTVVPRFGLPDWTVRAVIIAALLGLPLVLLLAWSFDLSWSGLRRESLTPPVAAATGAVWRIPSFWIALALGIGLTVSAQQAWQRLVRPATAERPSVAVLPFANMSPDPADAFFADGLQEEILASLARAGGLRVISRTSVEQYRDPDRNLREIADALDVDYVIEGSVRRAGDELRLTLQLIDGRTDEHVWAETYDRKLRNALQLQRTVAEQVVASVGAVLTPTELRFIAGAAPAVPAAYQPYLHALALWGGESTMERLRTVEGLLNESVAADPRFALAYALRAKARIWLAVNHLDRDARLTDGADGDIDRALQLQPGLPEALTARGLYEIYVSLDPERGLEYLTQALAAAPNDPDSLNIAGLAQRRLSRFDEAVDNFRQAARLTPGQERYAYRTFETLLALGRYDEAEADRLDFQRQFPQHGGAALVKFWIRFLQTGETAGWREEYVRRVGLGPVSPQWFMHAVRFFSATDDMAGLARALEGPVAPDQDRDLARELTLGAVYVELGDPERAVPYLEAVVGLLTAYPDDPINLASAAIALALLGRPNEALEHAERALQFAPPQRENAINYTLVAKARAWVLIYTRTRAEEGYAEIERLLGGWDMSPQELLVQPPARLLRDDPRLQQIVRSKLSR